ncbi:MAG: hypothetical protein A3A26_02335 [Candidatus Zambryskibacteria bacterium RIFCSPLOWO2_01_FULL_47_14]|uniref:Small ribosomal subunit protein bS6 n=1 Tax=Candidatus Zambryskibacteria bacterium RIFCSPLOWO2_01_FULL_47_14 TaxID=1802763 RepID=A0A1G2U8A3_9BACT|nr:MAG: hypothetical protein A3A26_02335 [Candidatus Zambryskibacteria bacterium RIFCSPLOWO2_01_FULL_47_14]
MQIYELGYLILPSIAEDNLPMVEDALKAAIAKEGGNVFAGEVPFRQLLAYTMSKTVGSSRYVVNEAYVGWVKFEAEPNTVPQIKDSVEKMSEILRHLIVKAPKEATFTFAEARKKLEEREVKEPAETRIEEEVAVE